MVTYHTQAIRNYVYNDPELKAKFIELGKQSSFSDDRDGERRMKYIFYHMIKFNSFRAERYAEKLRLQPKQKFHQDEERVMKFVKQVGWRNLIEALHTHVSNKYASAVEAGTGMTYTTKLEKLADKIKDLPKDFCV